MKGTPSNHRWDENGNHTFDFTVTEGPEIQLGKTFEVTIPAMEMQKHIRKSLLEKAREIGRKAQLPQ